MKNFSVFEQAYRRQTLRKVVDNFNHDLVPLSKGYKGYTAVFLPTLFNKMRIAHLWNVVSFKNFIIIIRPTAQYTTFLYATVPGPEGLKLFGNNNRI